MAYFLILPLWLASVLVMAAVAVATRVLRGGSAAFPYAWRILLWSSLGFLTANGLLLGGCALVASAAGAGAGAAHPLVGLGLVAALLLGPIVASAAGFGGGALVGFVLAWRSRRLGGEGRGTIVTSA